IPSVRIANSRHNREAILITFFPLCFPLSNQFFKFFIQLGNLFFNLFPIKLQFCFSSTTVFLSPHHHAGDREIHACRLTGATYLATSTCSLDSRVLARFAKISKISIVRPITSLLLSTSYLVPLNSFIILSNFLLQICHFTPI